MGLDLAHVIPSGSEQLEYFTVNDFSDSPGFLTKHKDLLKEREDEDAHEMSLVLYYTELGYQRKGMKKEFYTDFINNKLYFKLADVKKAFNYLQADHTNSLEELNLNFKTNFIDNFVEGQSIFFASW